MLKKIGNKLGCERGQGLAEYSLMLGIIAVAALLALASLSDGIEGVGSAVSQLLTEKAGDLNN